MRKFILLLLIFISTNKLCKAQTPNIKLSSAISVSPSSIPKGSYITVSTTVKNNGVSGTFDFECDFYTSSGNFLTVVQKQCNISIQSGKTATITFTSNSPINYSIGSYQVGVKALFSNCFGCGASTSCAAKTPGGFTNPVSVSVVSSCTAVSIGSQPQNKTVTAGNTATFSVTANGTSPFLYFWYKNGTHIPGASSSSYTTLTLSSSDNGNTYYCIVTNCNSSQQAVSNTATLTVTSGTPSTPDNFQVINQNPSATMLRVVWNASSGATSYDIWQNCSSGSIVNTGNTFRDFTNLTPGQTYSYRVVAKNSSGSSLPTLCLSRTLPDYPPSLSSPSNGNTGVSATPTFQWQLSPNNSSYYILEINTTNNFSGSVVARILVNGTSQSYSLSPGTTYYWRVASAISGSSGFVIGNFSSIRNFTTSGGCNAPNVSFSPSNSTINSGGNATFSANFTGTSLSYQWQVSTNGGSSYNSLSNGGIYSNATTTTLSITGATLSMNGYRYRCFAQNSCGTITSNSAVLSVNTSTPPVANFTSTTSNISAGDSVQFYDASSNSPTSWQWTFTGGSPSTTITKTSQNPSVTFTNAGSYKVSLTVSNSAGSSNPKTISGYVTVNSIFGQSVIPNKSAVVGNNKLQQTIADPIQIGTGTYKYIHTDFTLPVVLGNLKFTRYYNSYNNSDSGALGYGWRHSYSYSVQNYGDTIWDITYPDGHRSRFIPLYNGNGVSFPLYGGTYDSLIKTGTGEYWMYSKEQTVFKFTSSGTLSDITDPNGNGIVLNYTGNKVTSIRGPGWRIITLQYSGNRISSVTTPLGRICRFGYDNNDNLVYAISAKGDTTKFMYDSNHLMKEIIDGLGNTMLANTYDNQGRVISQADAYSENTTIIYNTPSAGVATIKMPGNDSLLSYHDDFYRVVKSVNPLQNARTLAYDDENNPDTVTNEKHQISTSKHDAHGNAIIQTLPGNQTYTSAYNKFQKPIEIIDPRGFKTTFSYDANGNLVALTFPDSSHRYFSYDPNGTLTHFITGTNDTTYFYYHNYGDLAKITYPNGNKLFWYDSDGRLDSIQDENGNITRLVLDNNDNITKITDALGQTITFAYDANDQLLEIKDKMGFITRFSYDKKGRLITRKNAMNSIDSFVYDIRDNLVKWIDANGHETVYGYDKVGRQISITNAAGQIKYEYDEIGNIKKFIDPKNQTTAIGYSPANIVSSILNPVNQLDSLQFDNIGNVSSFLNYRGKTRNYKYDQLERLDTVIDVDGEITVYAYDGNGNLKSLRDGNGNTQTFAYNKGRLTSHKDAENNQYSFVYDSVGNVKTINKPVGSIAKTYDVLNRLTKVTMTTGGTYTYTYDANDNVKTISNNSDTSYFFYDSLDRMVKYVDPFKNSVQYGYDKVGNITKIIYPGTKFVQYTYDSANRLETVKDWKNNVFKYFYDTAGNVRRLLYPDGSYCTYTYDPANRITSKFSYLKSNIILYGQVYRYFNDSIEETRYGDAYPSPPSSRRVYKYYKNDAVQTDSVNLFFPDGNGNRTKEIVPVDTITYTYTTDQLLSSLKQHDITTTFRYDGLGHRIGRTKGGNETRYILNLNSPLSLVLQTTDSSGKVQANYIYGLGLLEQIDSAGNELFYYFDTRHNTIAVKDKLDSVKVKYSYTLYGLVNKTDSLIQPFTFLGEFGVEQETDSCYYIRARYYDASTGRFLSKDPLFGDEFEPQSLNRYVYAMNNPITSYDITGLCREQGSNIGKTIIETIGVTSDIYGNATHNKLYWQGKSTNKIYTTGLYGTTNFLNKQGGYANSYKVVGKTLNTAKSLGTVLGAASVLYTAYDIAYGDGLNWENTLNAAFGLAGFIPGIGWAISGTYFIANTTTFLITNKTIGQHLDD